MRSPALLCLTTLVLATPCLAHAYLSDVVQSAPQKEALPDGITLSASGVGGRFVKHTLTLTLEEKGRNSAAEELIEKILARQKTVVAAMEALGLKFQSATYPSPQLIGSSRSGGRGGFGGGGLGGGGFGGGLGEAGDVVTSIQITFRLPDGPCDGETLAGHSRKKFVEAVVKAGAKDTLTLLSELDPKRYQANFNEAIVAAMKNGRATAEMLAQASGTRLGKVKAVRLVIQNIYFSSSRYLTLTATEITSTPGQSGGVPAFVELRFAIK